MNKYIAFLLLAFSGSVYAEQYLCIAEAGAGVSFNKKTNSFESKTYDVSSQKFILSNNSGKWVVKNFGSETVWLPCPTDSMCLYQDGTYGGHFSKGRDNIFTAMWFNLDTDKREDEL